MQKILAKAEKEIRKWEKQKKGSGKKLYFAYIIFIITLIYATDEIASSKSEHLLKDSFIPHCVVSAFIEMLLTIVPIVELLDQ